LLRIMVCEVHIVICTTQVCRAQYAGVPINNVEAT
jgi:hypothetical protein